MPSSTIAAGERGGRPKNVITVSAPTDGVIKTLGVRAGMPVAAGQTLAEINGLGTVWLNADVPEAVAGQLKSGPPVPATLTAFPGPTLAGRGTVIPPDVQADSRPLSVRKQLRTRE